MEGPSDVMDWQSQVPTQQSLPGSAAVSSLFSNRAPALNHFPIASLSARSNHPVGISQGPNVLRAPHQFILNGPKLGWILPGPASQAPLLHSDRAVLDVGRQAFHEASPVRRRRSLDEFAENESIATQPSPIREAIPGSFPSYTPPHHHYRGPLPTMMRQGHPEQPRRNGGFHIAGIADKCNTTATILSNIVVQSSRKIMSGFRIGGHVAFHNRRRVKEATRAARLLARRGSHIVVQTIRAAAQKAGEIKRRLIEYLVVQRPPNPPVNPALLMNTRRATPSIFEQVSSMFRNVNIDATDAMEVEIESETESGNDSNAMTDSEMSDASDDDSQMLDAYPDHISPQTLPDSLPPSTLFKDPSTPNVYSSHTMGAFDGDSPMTGYVVPNIRTSAMASSILAKYAQHDRNSSGLNSSPVGVSIRGRLPLDEGSADILMDRASPEVKNKKSVHFFASPNTGAPVNSVKFIEEDSIADSTINSSALPASNGDYRESKEDDLESNDDELESISDLESIDDLGSKDDSHESTEDVDSVGNGPQSEASSGDKKRKGAVRSAGGAYDQVAVDLDEVITMMETWRPDSPRSGGPQDTLSRIYNLTYNLVIGMIDKWAPNKVSTSGTDVSNKKGKAKVDEQAEAGSSTVEVKDEHSTKPSIALLDLDIERYNISGRRNIKREHDAEEEKKRNDEEDALQAHIARLDREAEERAAIVRAEANAKWQIEEAERQRCADEAAAQAGWLTKMGRMTVPANTTLIQPLSPEAEQQLDAIMNRRHTDHVATTSKGTPLSRKDFGSVFPRSRQDRASGWLNDEIMTAYLQLLIDFALTRCGHKRNDIPKFVTFSHVLIKNLTESGYPAVARWATRAKIGGKDLLEAEYVLIPVNPHVHWTLLVVSPTRKTIEYYDSMNDHDGTSHHMIDTIKIWLAAELGSNYNAQEWTSRAVAGPQQENTNDCGVFALTTAKMILTGWEPKGSYETAHIPNQRKRMLMEIWQGSLEGEFAPVIGGPGGNVAVGAAPAEDEEEEL